VYFWFLIEIVLGLGVGENFRNMLIALQATIRQSDVAVATATFSFIVLLGATLGIAIGEPSSKKQNDEHCRRFSEYSWS
jgi:hypothetical protein